MNLARWAERNGVARVTAYGKRAAANRAKRALAAATEDREAT